MTWCQQTFASFNDHLKLDETRLGRIHSAIGKFQTFCNSDSEINVAIDGDILLQGSIATNSAIKPLSGDEFDVDIVCPIDIECFDGGMSPSELFAWFVSRLKQDEFYGSNLEEKSRCVRINYAGDFHIDIIPAIKNSDNPPLFQVPARDLGDWIENDPIGFTNWIKERDRKSEGPDEDGVGHFVRGLRYTKRWRDHYFAEDAAPSSILLSVFLGKHEASVTYQPPLDNPLYPKFKTDAAYLFDMLRITEDCIRRGAESAYKHPTLDEDLGIDWREDNEPNFLNQLLDCIENLRKAIYSEDEAYSIAHFQAALGASFPSE